MTDHGSTPACYRHPDRPTRLSCTECGRPVCVDCSRDAAVGQKCPDCATPTGRNRVIQGASLRRLERSTTPVTWFLIAVNVALFLAGMLDGELERTLFVDGAHLRKPAITWVATEKLIFVASRATRLSTPMLKPSAVSPKRRSSGK